jgi:hypothetical protein
MEEDTMTTRLKLALPIALMVASAGAFAGTRLTPQQCNAYPFQPTHGALTQDDLNRELAELESVGYRPALDNYSLDISDARARLNAEYVRDCLPKGSTASLPSTSG